MAGSQGDKLLTAAGIKTICAYDHGASPLPDGRKCGLEILVPAGLDELDPQPDRPASGFDSSFVRLGVRIAWINEHRHDRRLGNDLMQQLQPLRDQRNREQAHAGDVLAGAVEVRDEPGLDRIGTADEDDRDSRGRCLRRLRGRKQSCSDCSWLATSQIGRQCWQLIIFPVRPAKFELHVAALDESAVLQAAAERVQAEGVRLRRSLMQKSDHRHRLLRPRRQRPRGRGAPPSSVMNSRRSSFDHLVGAGEQRRRDVQAERLRGRKVDDEVELGRLLDRDVGGLCPAQNLVDIVGGASEQVREVWSIRHETSRFDLLPGTVIVGSRAPSAKVLIRTRLVFMSGSPQT